MASLPMILCARKNNSKTVERIFAALIWGFISGLAEYKVSVKL
jgi:hypothetical protein